METHFTWSIENSGCCPKCGKETTLIVAPSCWYVHLGDGEVEVDDEKTAHYCNTCQSLTSLSVNTLGFLA